MDQPKRYWPCASVLLIVLSAAISACSDNAPAPESAEEFAARINAPPAGQSAGPASPQGHAGQNAGADPALANNPAIPMPADNSGDPRPPDCGAPLLSEFIGRSYTQAIGRAINEGVPNGTRVRVLPPGSLSAVTGRVDRLNVMLDNGGRIKDIRCG